MFLATILPAGLLAGVAAVGSADADAEARRLLLDLAKGLQTDRKVVDTITVTGRARGVEIDETLRLALGVEQTAQLTYGDVTAVIEEDFASVTHAKRPDAMYVAEADEEFFEVLLGARGLPMKILPHLALRAAEDDADMALEAFFVGWDDEVEIAGVRSVAPETASARKAALREITLRHTDWEERILISPLGPRLVAQHGKRGDVEIKITHDMDVRDTAAEEIAFDAGDREQANDLMNVLFATEGERAMPFAAPNLAGDLVSLDDLRKDKVVVLDFWATWCVPCRGGLSMIQTFVDAAREEGVDVEVLAVNVAERLEPDERREKVGDYWKRAGFTFPTVLDLDDSIRIAYRADTIPVTVVVGRDGKVHRIHKDASPDLAEWLADAVRSAGAGS